MTQHQSAKIRINQRPKGFTLIELLIVVAILGTLAVITTVVIGNTRAKSRDAKRIADFKQIQSALDLFYDRYEKYPQTPGHQTWAGHWMYFSECLEKGKHCWGLNTQIDNYTPVISKVPQDPMYNGNVNDANTKTYYYGYPSGCTDGQSYRLAVYLETDHPALKDDLDGSFYNNNEGCNDDKKGYCIGVGTCTGW